jgi:hypothetical protein
MIDEIGAFSSSKKIIFLTGVPRLRIQEPERKILRQYFSPVAPSF